MKVLYFDTETTGLTPAHGIIQIAGMVEIDGEVVHEFNLKIKPFPGDEISDEALQVHGYSKEQIIGDEFEAPHEACVRLLEIFDKYVDKYDKNDKMYPAGYNVKFDVEMLNAFLRKAGYQYGSGSYLWWKMIDPLPLFHWLEFCGVYQLPNYKLETVCNAFGIEIKAHDALSDIKATRQLVDRARIKIKDGYDRFRGNAQ